MAIKFKEDKNESNMKIITLLLRRVRYLIWITMLARHAKINLHITMSGNIYYNRCHHNEVLMLIEETYDRNRFFMIQALKCNY